MRIQDLMHAPVITIRGDASVGDLVSLLAQHNIGAVVVSEDGVHVDGIASERDVVRHLGDGDPNVLLDSSVADLMTRLVCSCAPTDSTSDLMALMTEHRVRHIPVLAADATLSGIVSIGDIVKARIEELAFERDQLDAYVAGG